MKREIVKINEKLCTGCGDCVPACHEGALQIIDGKARLVSDLMCDGLGACLGHCPEGAITIEKREAEPYDEVKVMQQMVKSGKNTIIAHLRHLKDHKEYDYLKQGISYLERQHSHLDFDVEEIKQQVNGNGQEGPATQAPHAHSGGCPGAQSMSFKKPVYADAKDTPSALEQWPVQMHLINPLAGYFQNSDLVLAADCVAYALGNFHSKYLKGKSLAIACPKLDTKQEIYLQKLISLIDDARVNTIHVMIMQVPCCGGLLQLVKQAALKAQRKVPVKQTIVGVQGDILKEDWIEIKESEEKKQETV